MEVISTDIWGTNDQSKVVFLVKTILLHDGVAYARWTEQDNNNSGKNSETKLSFVDYATRLNSGAGRVPKAENAPAQ